jgi:hypothetical protein
VNRLELGVGEGSLYGHAHVGAVGERDEVVE